MSRISLTRPSLARQIEDLLMRMARAGQIRDKVPDEELKRLLTQVSMEGNDMGSGGMREMGWFDCGKGDSAPTARSWTSRRFCKQSKPGSG